MGFLWVFLLGLMGFLLVNDLIQEKNEFYFAPKFGTIENKHNVI